MDEDEDEDDDEEEDADEDEDEGDDDDDDDDETSSLPTELSLTDSKDDLLTKAAMLSPFAWPPRSKSSPSSSSSSTCRFLFFFKENNTKEFSLVKKPLQSAETISIVFWWLPGKEEDRH